MDTELLAEARRAQERLIDAERDAEVARADFHRAVRRLHLNGASLRELAGGLGLSHQRVHQIVESAGGSRRWLRRDRPRSGLMLDCSFCGRGKSQVRKLIAGPGVYICDNCVGLAGSVTGSGEPVAAETGWLTAVPAQQPRVQCSFCGKCRDQVSGLAMGPPARADRKAATICTECLSLCDEIIAEELGPTEP